MATKNDLLDKEEKQVQTTTQTLPTQHNAPARGFESEVDKSDLIIPRAKLCQQMTPEVIERKVDAGDIISNLTGEVIQEDFIPVLYYKEYVKFNPRKKTDPGYDSNFEPGDLIWKTQDATDPRVLAECSWDGDEPPTALTILNFLCYFPEEISPLIVGFSKTSYGAGKKILSLAKFSNKDIFAKKYSLTSKLKQNDQGSFYIYDVKPVGNASNEEFAAAEALWESMHKHVREIKTEDITDEEIPF